MPDLIAALKKAVAQKDAFSIQVIVTRLESQGYSESKIIELVTGEKAQ